MSIWRTSIPTIQDFPIWAFIDGTDEVVLLREPDEFEEPVTWCKATVPQAPKTALRQKYEMLSDSSIGEAWGTYEWFKAGYDYGKLCKGSCGCRKNQAEKSCKSPFVDPEDYFGNEPKESAHDEQL